MKKSIFVITLSTLIFFNILSCQKKTTKTDSDRISEAMEFLDSGRTQEAIDTLTPITRHNKSPKVMSLIASAYLYRSQISTREIIELFLNFSIQNTKTIDPKNENLNAFAQMISALDDFFLKFSVVPALKNKDQESDLNTALTFLKSAKPSTPGIALQRGLIRLILAKYIFTYTLESLLKSNQNNECEFSWPEFYKNLQNLLLVSKEILNDLKEANPKKASQWGPSIESINDTQRKLEAIKDNDQPIDPLAQDLLIYFFKSHSIEIGCHQ
jgi:hypothetical protein